VRSARGYEKTSPVTATINIPNSVSSIHVGTIRRPERTPTLLPSCIPSLAETYDIEDAGSSETAVEVEEVKRPSGRLRSRKGLRNHHGGRGRTRRVDGGLLPGSHRTPTDESLFAATDHRPVLTVTRA
jgi:hypothetical protein